MFGLLKRLFGRQDKTKPASDRSGRNPRRSVTADILAHGRDGGGRAGATADERRAAARGEPDADSFDPYNTGKFDRSASWERISRTQR